MPDEVLSQLLLSMLFITLSFLITWLITRFRKPERLEAGFAVPWKEAVLAIGYVILVLFAFALFFFFWSRSLGRSIGTSDEYTLLRMLYQWGLYAAVFFVPVFAIIRLRRQSLESVGITRKNWRLSIAVGVVLSTLCLSLSTTPERFLSRAFTPNTFYGFFYFLAVGLGEELLFRGFLQLRCSAWLGKIRGLLVSSAVMAFAHIPQRILVAGLGSAEAVGSAVFLIPISLLMGFVLLRTQNVIGPAVLHTLCNLISIL